MPPSNLTFRNNKQTCASLQKIRTPYRKSEEPENRDPFFEGQYLLIYVNNCTQTHLTLPNLTKSNNLI